MAAKKRRTHPTVKEALFRGVCGFNFFKAVHLLEGYDRERSLGNRLSPKHDPVQFCVKPGFSFPASDIMAIRNGHARLRPELTVNFMGLIGPKGVLPDWYNAHAQALNHKKDYALTDFLDLFHHRLITLFYLAWKKYRLVENYRADGRDAISKSLANIVGLDARTQKADAALDKVARRRCIHFSGLASRIVPGVATLAAIVGNAVGTKVRVHQFVERMIPIHEQDRTCLGRANSTLRVDALCGRRIRDVASFFIVELGPISWKKYMAFQPRSPNLALVRKLILFIVGLEYEFEIRLVIKGPEIPCLQLGGSQTGTPLLGRTVLLKRPGRAFPKNIVIREFVDRFKNLHQPI